MLFSEHEFNETNFSNILFQYYHILSVKLPKYLINNPLILL